MKAALHEVEQFTMPVALAKPTLGQLREEREAMIARLTMLAAHRNQVVSIPRERLEQIACAAVCVMMPKEAMQMDWIIANEPACTWARRLPSRRWRERLQRLRTLGERIVMTEMQSAPNARRLSILPPPAAPAEPPLSPQRRPRPGPRTVIRLGQTSIPTSTSLTMKFTNVVIGAVVTLPPEREPKLRR